MKCCGCQRENAATRRFCGGCGSSFAAACAGCGFENDGYDRYCGGCGIGLSVRAAAAATPGAALTDELAGLFAPVSAEVTPTLPEKLSQDHLDAMFGVSS